MDNQSRLLNSDEQWNFSTDKYFYEIKNLKSIRNTMGTRFYILILLFMSIVINLNAQNEISVDTTSFCYLNGITQQAQAIYEYRITNNSNEDYLTWGSLAPISNKSDIELVHEYFKSRKGDFSFIEMMYENLLDKRPISIGYSFVKNIAVGKTFSYFIDKADAKFYKERIVILKKKDVEQYLRMQIDEKYFFKSSCIYLIGKNSSNIDSSVTGRQSTQQEK